MVELRRNKKTGLIESFRNRKKVGPIITMGDETNGTDRSKGNKQSGRSNKSKG